MEREEIMDVAAEPQLESLGAEGRVLVVDTSGPVESVAILERGQLIGERNTRRDRSKSPGLLDDIDALCEEAGWPIESLSALACGLGPGSFTGLRVGVALCKGIAAGIGCPLFGIPSVGALLAQAPPGSIALLDVRRGELHAMGSSLKGETRPADALIDHLTTLDPAPTAVLGNGALKHRTRLLELCPQLWIPSAPGAHQIRAAQLPFSMAITSPLHLLEPIYARASDAEINYPNGFPMGAALLERLS